MKIVQRSYCRRVCTREISPFDVEVGHRYRFTFRRAVLEGSSKRTLTAVVGAAFWGEVPLVAGKQTFRVQRDDVVRVCEVS